ncbi:hypothetical protein TREMEDRAFT_29901 [Tremella mesenterica DSM 1558]|uniref:uncharacterized protein n=1 Tax=Tremella mesenterica (strain ATCC 24925 / CBS 8224 / DSM 1558 / NBRC 9311 / NRRL Y-6157 / RJB 2259-6 / UBC 559-6) TaxID=578456 RepID=UPI0003F49267|nr:uncharacterized protein TREMEDRAFT_29901 [Tremella mesenterica DSM 1558]EIW70059.1 hypothetical protein TREMEDRAFT_29901 [Tremella mesenterica DSM 1558]
MQSDLPRADDPSSIPTPSSPTISSIRHHATPTVQDPDLPLSRPSSSSLRRRLPSPSSQDNPLLRICLMSPFGEHGSSMRRERSCSPSMKVNELKDQVGEEGEWDREGMRLIWRGRLLKDEEILGDILNTRDISQVQTLHIVARASTKSRASFAGNIPLPRPSPILNAPSPNPRTSGTTQWQSVAEVALTESIHYLLFMARHHLCHLMNTKPLRWQETIPSPLVSQEAARLGVMSVIRGFASHHQSRQEGWDNWEGVFLGESESGLKGVWERGREVIQKEIKDLWAGHMGKTMSDDPEGNIISIEYDGNPYTLCLPPLDLMTPRQLSHLLLYLRITTFTPLLYPILEQVNRPPPPIPTPTVPLPQTTRVIYRRTFRINLPAIPRNVLVHMFFSLLKLNAMLWMLTRGMGWDDPRFWVIGGAAAGWWVGDGLNRYRIEMRQRRRTQIQPTPLPNQIPQNQQNGQNGQNQAPNIGLGIQAGREGRAVQNGRNPNGRSRRRRNFNPLNFFAYVHLNTDRRQLHLSRSTSEPRLRDRRRVQPSWFQTQLLLPVSLWFITLVPSWESARGRRIRQRERAMRVVVGGVDRSSVSDSNLGLGISGSGMRRHVLPDGLGEAAKRYYERVLQRGEGIDWEEEREAQRALGVGDEEDRNGEGAGMGLGLF